MKTRYCALSGAVTALLLTACAGKTVAPTANVAAMPNNTQPAPIYLPNGSTVPAVPAYQPPIYAPTSTAPIQTSPTVLAPENGVQMGYQDGGYQTEDQQTGGYQTGYDNNGYLDDEILTLLDDLLEAQDMSMVEGSKIDVERYGDVWDRVRSGYKFAPKNDPRIDAQKRWFATHQDYLNRLTARASRYLYYTVAEAERRGIPTELALLPVIESSYDPSATSNASAAGLWQFIPDTARAFGLERGSTFDGRRDVIESTRAAYDFLTLLYNQFGDWELALAGYNAGGGRVARAIEANRRAGRAVDFWSLGLPKETRDYVPRLLAVAQIVGNPSAEGVYLPAIANHPHFRSVPAPHGTSLVDVARITGVPADELKLLNPGLLNGVIEGIAPERVLIPNSVMYTVDPQISALGDHAPRVETRTDYVQPENTSSKPNLH